MRLRDGSKRNSRRWAATRRAVFERDNYRCTSCGRNGKLECHHVVNLASGGAAFDLSNLVSLCVDCHLRAHDKRPESGERAAWRALVQELL